MTTLPIAQWTKAWAINQSLKMQYDSQTESTNQNAKSDLNPLTKPALFNGPVSEPALYLTEKQTGGRGRGSNTWSSTPGQLLSTWSYALAFPPQPILSPLIGLATYEAATTAFPGVNFNLKAPNDLYIGDKKVAGLLVETVQTGADIVCAIGLGFNVSQAPQDLAPQATALSSATTVTETNWSKFLSQLQTNFAQALKDSRSDLLRLEVRTRLVNALNLHPLLKDPVLEIDELGQILTPSRRILWHEL